MTPRDQLLRRRACLARLVGLGAIAVGSAYWLPTGALADGSDGAGSTLPQDTPAQDTPASDQATAYGAAVWIRIPWIGVDSPSVDVGVVDGYYDVPWFDIGHHFDSANPGESGNSIFNGHVLTIDAGRVFSRLRELAPGDAVFVYTAGYRTGWAVTSTVVVPDGDDTLLGQTTEPRLTLYTCTGSFNPIERTFADRLVVTGEFVEVVPRG